jgi:hypothetical protein
VQVPPLQELQQALCHAVQQKPLGAVGHGASRACAAHAFSGRGMLGHMTRHAAPLASENVRFATCSNFVALIKHVAENFHRVSRRSETLYGAYYQLTSTSRRVNDIYGKLMNMSCKV